jgi:addiction module RelE/StbE family toxin
MQYLYTARFLRSLKKCEEAVQEDIVRAVKLFETGKNNRVLKLHKLHGKFKAYQSFSVNYSYRVIIKITKETIYYVDVGTHTIYL